MYIKRLERLSSKGPASKQISADTEAAAKLEALPTEGSTVSAAIETAQGQLAQAQQAQGKSSESLFSTTAWFGSTRSVALTRWSLFSQRSTNAILECRRDPPQTLLVACVWSHWRAAKSGEKEPFSFAIITENLPRKLRQPGTTACCLQSSPRTSTRGCNLPNMT